MLSPEEIAAVIQAVHTEGFCWLPRPHDKAAVDDARQTIERELQRDGRIKDPLNGFCLKLLASPKMLDLYYKSEAHQACSALLTHGAVRALKQVQIALRFPGDGAGYVPQALDAREILQDDTWRFVTVP